MLPDLKNPEPGRKKVDRTNVVMEDIVDALVKATPSLHRFIEAEESRYGGEFNRYADKIIETVELLKRRVNDIRGELNKARRTS